MEELNKELDDIISYIKNTPAYLKCSELKLKMSKNKELKKMIEEVKCLQKKYIKSNYNEEVGEKLKLLENKLSDIPIYVQYNQYLEEVNEQITYVNERLNDYFYNLLNERN